jgi:hypothetical protein
MTIITGTVMTVMTITTTIQRVKMRAVAVLTAVAQRVVVVAYMITHASLALYSRVRISMVCI